MPEIRVLPDRVANQIAAGEVIERPAAVVKELLENSLDAGATRVEIEFKNGGRSYIRIEDNGCGMGRDQALLSIERHATSKIREADDLLKIASFGFRGEALPSIASVSRFQLRSRTNEDQAGTELMINGGKLIHVKECGMPVGTRIEVSHLFNSVPARRKFLKADATEAAHIIHLVRIYAIANPGTAFSLLENGRLVFNSPACPGLGDRVKEIFGGSIAEGLLPIEMDEAGFKLNGHVSEPGRGRSTRHEMVTIVNRRPVTSPTLNQAIIESYHAYLPRGRYPIAFLFLDLEPSTVDVNVHPAKREIRFREAARVRGFVIRSLLDCLRNSTDAAKPAEVRGTHSEQDSARVVPVGQQADVHRIETAQATSRPTLTSVAAKGVLQPAPVLRPKEDAPRKSWETGWKFIGHVQRGMAVFDSTSGLILLDRRSSHQRILYEDLENQYRDQKVAAQQLLLPVPMELDALGSNLLLDHLDFLNTGGFKITEFGRNFFRIEAVPVWTTPEQAESLLQDLVGLMKDGKVRQDKPVEAFDQVARLACTRAVRLDEAVSEKEMISLASRLLQCRNPLISPLGKPTYIELGRNELDRRFMRQ
ncbi:MAG: DNA mismatch repair endonuclease MutL [Verrucomicrobiae bacterium]|nr:DNA mismatch repair endonuclease MutL [Verrucomicrobiae bacterium]